VRSPSPREGGRLGWFLRQYAWLVLICVLAFAGAPLVLGAATPTYQADAIVVARQLAVNPRVLPQLGEAVFAGGGVAARVAEDPAVGGDGAGLIPARLSVVIPQDSIVLVVQARDEEPEVAARMADLGATAYAEALNRGGAGVGQFAVQAPAVVPGEPLRRTSPVLLALSGALAGLAVGVGLAALIGVLRRPIVTGRDVEDAVGVPLLGTVEVPLGPPGSYPGPVGVRGIASVARWMATLPTDRLLLISPPSAAGLRQRVYVMIGVLLASVRSVAFRAPDDLVEVIGQHREGLPTRSPSDEASAGTVAGQTSNAGGVVLVDGGAALEIVDPLATRVSVVAIAPRGISRTRLRALADDYRDAGLVGIVLAEGGSAVRSRPTRRIRFLAPTAGEQSATALPEPGRA
jgi:hypothetical protein